MPMTSTFGNQTVTSQSDHVIDPHLDPGMDAEFSEEVSFKLCKKQEFNDTMYTLEMRDSVNPSFGIQSDKHQNGHYENPIATQDGISLRQSHYLKTSSCTNLLQGRVLGEKKSNISQSSKHLVPKHKQDLKMSAILEEKKSNCQEELQRLEMDTKDTDSGNQLKTCTVPAKQNFKKSGKSAFVIDFSQKRKSLK
jgi:hypothetical protein